MKKSWLLFALVLTAALGVEELYRYTFCREGSRLLAPFLDSKGHEDAYYPRRDAAAFRLRRTPSEPMEIRSVRGERLRGWYYPLGGKGRRIAFLVHGYRSEHAEAADSPEAGRVLEAFARFIGNQADTINAHGGADIHLSPGSSALTSWRAPIACAGSMRSSRASARTSSSCSTAFPWARPPCCR